MNAESRLDELLSRWHQGQAAGEDLSAAELCRDSPDLLPQLEQRLVVLRRMGQLFETNDLLATSVQQPRPPLSPLFPPRTLEGYEILGELGRGGMGVVYKARQTRLKRLVALKMILAGRHAGAEQLARFRTEAQAAARLKHPNIVQVYEVGAHDGLPFLSLEFVDGDRLDRRLGGVPLPPRVAAELIERLALAVHAAHQQGIVHRDLKPANILLEREGDGAAGLDIPKITDFGLAKQSDAEDLTATDAVLGTPSYMAPEQAAGKTRDVGPGADIYALGAILYEALTGRPPFRGATLTETLAQVREREPVPPTRLKPQVPRDLETVCLKCLQKEPARRYPSAFALAEDLRRFQNDEPILARPVGQAERLWRWCRRNPAVARLSAALLLVLVGGLVGVTLLWWHAESERAAAVASRQRADNLAAEAKHQQTVAEEQSRLARAETEKANREANKANRTAQVLADIFKTADPLGIDGIPLLKASAGEALTVPEILKRGAEKVSRDLANEPAAQAKLLDTLGGVYCTLGMAAEARPLLEKALAVRRRLLPKDHPDLAASLHNLGWLRHMTGDYDEAERLYREALTIRRSHAETDPLAPASTLFNLGWLLADLEDFPAAADMFKEAVDLRLAVLGTDHRDVAMARGGLVASYLAQGKIEAAVPHYLQAMATLRKVEGGESLVASIDLFQKGVLARDLPPLARRFLLGLDDDRSVENCLKQALAMARGVVHENHPWLALIFHELAYTLEHNNKGEEAEGYYRDCLRIAKVYGLDHPKTTILLGNFCPLLESRGKKAEAEQLLDEALQLRLKRYPLNHYAIAEIRLIQSALLEGPDTLPRRKQLLREVLASYSQTPGPPRKYLPACLREMESCFDPAELVDAAGELARSAARRPEASGERDAYAKHAVKLLRGALKAGFKDAQRLARDKDLEGLRQRDDFQKLVATLQK
jgi:serine/threonine protein kinase/tetratricopeptide (TPR) repeat protein